MKRAAALHAPRAAARSPAWAVVQPVGHSAVAEVVLSYRKLHMRMHMPSGRLCNAHGTQKVGISGSQP